MGILDLNNARRQTGALSRLRYEERKNVAGRGFETQLTRKGGRGRAVASATKWAKPVADTGALLHPLQSGKARNEKGSATLTLTG